MGRKGGDEKLRVVSFGREAVRPSPRSPLPFRKDRGTPHETAAQEDSAGERPHHQERFCTNRISTAKYNVFTFLPKFLFVMFSRAAYFYFLVQMCLSWWEIISPFGGIGFTMALLFVLFVSGAKEAVEDLKRHQFDRITNQSVAHIVHLTSGDDDNGDHHQDTAHSHDRANEGGGFGFGFGGHGASSVEIRDEKWEDVKVGQIILVMDEEEVPADCICIHTALDDACYVKTANLDGETNLKIKRTMRGVELSQQEADEHERHHEELHGDGTPPPRSPSTTNILPIYKISLSLSLSDLFSGTTY